MRNRPRATDYYYFSNCSASCGYVRHRHGTLQICWPISFTVSPNIHRGKYPHKVRIRSRVVLSQIPHGTPAAYIGFTLSPPSAHFRSLSKCNNNNNCCAAAPVVCARAAIVTYNTCYCTNIYRLSLDNNSMYTTRKTHTRQRAPRKWPLYRRVLICFSALVATIRQVLNNTHSSHIHRVRNLCDDCEDNSECATHITRAACVCRVRFPLGGLMCI